ncbi:MAG TPA: PPOX class F420-dependent oxidoreductase [Actinomycetota bacterium]|nr:PPOX class F420-dependent oxidoreductase [Actinomycetota bacterium]
MDIAQAREFLAENHRAVLVTHRADGGVQTSPITIGVDDEDHGVISSRQTAFKVKNLRRDPRATVCVFNDRFFGQWVQIEGTVKIVELPEAMEGLVDYYRRISGEHPDWDDYRLAMEKDQRVLVLIDIERAGPDQHG